MSSNLIKLPRDAAKEFPEIIEAYKPFGERIARALELAGKVQKMHLADKYNEEVWKEARKIRLQIAKERNALDRERKNLKELAKRYSDAVDLPVREPRRLCQEAEEALSKIEQFEELEKVRKIAEIEIERKQRIVQIGGSPDAYPALAGYDDDGFETLLAGIEYQQKKAVEERKKQEQVEALQRERARQLATVGYFHNENLAVLSKEDFQVLFDSAAASYEERQEQELAKRRAEEEEKIRHSEEAARLQREQEEMQAKADKAYQADRHAIAKTVTLPLMKLKNALSTIESSSKQGAKEVQALKGRFEKIIEYYG